jgi:hypothetical protein
MAFAEPNTQIRYTLNGQEPTEKSPIYTRPLSFNRNFTTIKARVFSKIYAPSEVVEVTFIKDGLPIKSVESTPPNPKYTGTGTAGLIDNLGGNAGYSSNTWLGFQSDTVEVVLNLTKKETVKKVLIDMLQDFGSWIFLPEHVEAFYFNTAKNQFLPFANRAFNQEKETTSSFCTPSVLEAKTAFNTNKIKLKFHLLKSIPAWHAGKGQKSWIFIDEIKVY